MIDFFKLNPIHTTNTPRGRLLKSIPKKIGNSPDKKNPEISFVIKSKNSFSNGKIFTNSLLEQSFDFSRPSQTKELAKTSRITNHQPKSHFKSQTNTLSLDKTS